MQFNVLWIRRVDLFGEERRAREERIILRKLGWAQTHQKALEVALAAGESTSEKLDAARNEVADLQARLPRGDVPLFCICCVWCLASIWVLVTFYSNMNSILIVLWGSADIRFLQRYWPLAPGIWLINQFVTSSYWSGLIVALLLGLLWGMQRRLQRRHAITKIETFLFVVETLAILAIMPAVFLLNYFLLIYT